MTDAERKLWRSLKGSQMEGLSFRRQHPVGRYVLDFYCAPVGLAVELDGGQHGEPAVLKSDMRREDWLKGKGIRVLRFWNGDVMDEFDGVLEAIRREVLQLAGSTRTPTLTLPLAGGGNETEVDR
jgi:very-short-patch-repair endonuclease